MDYTKNNCEIFRYAYNFLTASNTKTFNTLLLESNYPRDHIFNLLRIELQEANLLYKIPDYNLLFGLECNKIPLAISLSEIFEDAINDKPDNLLLDYLFKIFRAVPKEKLTKKDDTDEKWLSYKYLCRALKSFQSFVNEYYIIYLILNYFPNVICRRSSWLDMTQHVDFQVVRNNVLYNIWIYNCSDYAVNETIEKIRSKKLAKGIHILLPISALDLAENLNHWLVYSTKALDLLDDYMQINAKRVNYIDFFGPNAKQLCSYIRSFEFYD